MNEVQDELKTVVLWISEQTSGMLLPAGLRARMALGCLDLAIEHQAGICALAEQALWGPVFALLQCMFDAFVRGVWLARCASDVELECSKWRGFGQSHSGIWSMTSNGPWVIRAVSFPN